VSYLTPTKTLLTKLTAKNGILLLKPKVQIPFQESQKISHFDNSMACASARVLEEPVPCPQSVTCFSINRLTGKQA